MSMQLRNVGGVSAFTNQNMQVFHSTREQPGFNNNLRAICDLQRLFGFFWGIFMFREIYLLGKNPEYGDRHSNHRQYEYHPQSHVAHDLYS